MNIADWLWRAARLRPEAPALLAGDRLEADYAAFAARARGVAGALIRRGIGPGDRVALFMRNRTAYLDALLGALWAGAAVVPINAKLHPREAGWILANAEAALVIADAAPPGPTPALPADALPELAAGDGPARPAPRADDDLAWLFYTSGTTGRPKGVMITHANLAAMSLCYPLDVDPVGPADAALYAAPMSHGAGLYAFVHIRAGARHSVPESGGFDAAEILALAPRIGEVSLFAAPTMVRRLVTEAKAQGLRGEGLKTVVYGGGPMYLADIEEAVAAMGPRFVQIYGQGESPMTITALPRRLVADRDHPRWRERLGSVGVAQSCVEVAVDAPEGEAGEVLARGPQVMAGYWRNPEATADALREGWLRTGDVGRLDADGFLTLTDRARDVIISGGTNIYPREVEEAALEHPDVAECAVVGAPHPDWGEQVVAFVVAEPGRAADPAALEAWLVARIARFKRPKRWIAVDALPKNAYGKVLKTDLRAHARNLTS
jgi:long-chain acyl-CoA synthetase